MSALLALACVGQSCIAQQTYAAPVQYQQQVYNQAYVEKTFFVARDPIDAQTYYAGLVGEQQRAQARAAEVQQATSSTDAKIDRLAALIEQLQRRIDAAEPPIPSKPASPADQLPRPSLPAPATPASEAVPPPPTISQASSNPTHAGAGIAVLVKHCADCHGKNGTRKGGRQFFDRSGQTLEADAVALSAMRDAILAGTMPPRERTQLTLREFALINEFVNQQAGSLAINTNQRKKIR